MNLWLAIGTVMAFGGLQFWLAFPAGFAFGLHPAVTFIAAAAGGVLSVLVVLIPGERLGAWLARRRKGRPRSKGTERASRIWEKYGLIGLAFLAPLFPGAPLGALFALALGTPKWRVLLWFSSGLLAWSAGVTLVAAFGLTALGG
ncbi:MAG: small multi-drug export protein [Euryarchaeota archaeon]|nr:small multi-drug export protein [Euryarchaeota archaeon]